MKREPVIELYCDPEAEWLPKFRQELRNAMIELDTLPNWREYYPGCTDVPKYLKRAGTPSISINGFLGVKGDQLIANKESLFSLVNSLKSKRRFSWIRAVINQFSFLMAVLIAFFPKCPFCWAAYMSLLTAWGIKRIPYQPWLLPVFCLLLMANIVSLYMSRKRHHYGPLIFSLTGAVLVISNRYWFQDMAVMYMGVGFLVVGSLWNSLSKRMSSSVGHYLFGWIK